MGKFTGALTSEASAVSFSRLTVKHAFKTV